jgi:hexosaminidase
MKQIFLLVMFFSHTAFAQQKADLPAIIPQPVKVQRTVGDFRITKNTVIAVQDEEDRKAARFFNDYLQQSYGFSLDVDRKEGKNYIRLATRKFIQAPEKDAYTLSVTKEGVIIEGDTYAGTFHGVQTLLQLMPAYDMRSVTNNNFGIGISSLIIPAVQIQDYPRFAYRGMHLDVARHFFDVNFVKRYIDYLAFHKLNYFHWHLTDDQGWRIEIKKHPLLTEVSSRRNGTIIGRYPGTGNDNQPYGGYYTQDQIREVVQYAAERHITVVPEIEMPGHASAAIAAYPWLSCFPQKETYIPSHPSLASQKQNGKKVQETWGVFEDVFCAGSDSTFRFLQEVLEEVLTLFPSKYIHIGGDESPKAHWKICPRCQARIKKEGLKDENHLQSYFVQRMEKYLNEKGRVLIGWDEILEGGLAPNAIVMSWRGEKGGIEAARQKHLVIMTPQKPVYFDHTQTRNEDSVTIGGFNPLEDVYSYEPVSKELHADNAKYIIGAQANLWTEYIKHPSKVEYMVFPRMSALSEVLWSAKENRSWTSFENRLLTQFRRYDIWKANYSKAYYAIKTAILPSPDRNGLLWQLQKAQNAGRIEYTWNERSATTVYKSPIPIKEPGTYTAFYYKDGAIVNTVSQSFHFHKATGKKVSITKTPNDKYRGQGGAFSLVNGVFAEKGLSHPDWLGWIGEDITATIDMGKTTLFSTVKLHTLDQNGSWVYLPQYVEVFVSNDGKKFQSAGRSSTFVKDNMNSGFITVTFNDLNARYIKLFAKNAGLIPEGQPGGGNKAWIFADEIVVQ